MVVSVPGILHLTSIGRNPKRGIGVYQLMSFIWWTVLLV